MSDKNQQPDATVALAENRATVQRRQRNGCSRFFLCWSILVATLLLIWPIMSFGEIVLTRYSGLEPDVRIGVSQGDVFFHWIDYSVLGPLGERDWSIRISPWGRSETFDMMMFTGAGNDLGSHFVIFDIQRSLTTGAIGFIRIVFPYWLILALFMLPLLWPLYRWRFPNAVQGICKQCGYDLRESKDACPECGAAIENDQQNVAQVEE